MNQKLTQDEDSVFSKDLFDSLYPDGIENHYWTKVRNKLVLSVIKQLEVASKNIIEVGCGRGIVTKYLRENQLTIEGYELANPVHYPGTEEYVHMGTDARLLPQEKRDAFEVMLLLDVVEHVKNPEAFLADLLSYFKNVKTVIITVPACQEIWSNFDVFNGHYRRYTMDMGNQLLQSAQMRKVYSSYAYHTLYAVMRLLLFFNVKKRSTLIHAPTKKNLFLHNLMSALLMVDYQLLPKNSKGSSLILAGERV